jgi:hypothetical protein
MWQNSGTSKTSFLLCFALLWCNPSPGTCQDDYEKGYFRLLDYLLAYPYDFLDKTTLEVSNMQSPPPNLPVSKTNWSVYVSPTNDPNRQFANIETGYSPITVAFSKGAAFSVSYLESMEIKFGELKIHLEKKGIVLDKSGLSKMLVDGQARGHFIVELRLVGQLAVINIYAFDASAGKIKG